MDTKTILVGLAGLILGGLIVSVAASSQSSSSGASIHGASSLAGKTGDEFDKAFLAEMIVHHEGAISMATLAKQNAKHDEVKKLADDILAAQSREIDMMQTWQGDWGYKNVPKSHEDNMGGH